LHNICVINEQEYVPFVVITIRSFPYKWHITRFVTKVIDRCHEVEQELLTLPELTPFFNVVRVVQSLVFSVVVFLSSNYGYWFFPCYLQTFLTDNTILPVYHTFYQCTTHFSRLESGYWRSISVKSNTSCIHCTFNFPLLVLLYIYFYYIFGKQFLNRPPSLHFHYAFQFDIRIFKSLTHTYKKMKSAVVSGYC
jgi:hypothetical protein